MSPHSRALIERLKISTLANGIRVGPSAEHELSEGGRVPLTLHEYATTGGVTFVAGERYFINAPFDEWYCERAEARLTFDRRQDTYLVHFEGHEIPVRALGLPRYLETRDAHGQLARDVVMSHGDRARLSPIDGCAFTCGFCDLGQKRYQLRESGRLVEALRIACEDTVLPVRHVLISGGTPGRKHEPYFDDVVSTVSGATAMAVDVMMTPRDSTEYVQRFVDNGVHGFSLNLELYDDEAARRAAPQKHRLGRETFARNIERAVEATGGAGRVRSLLIVGLEPIETTLEGVEFLARLGADPVLSPFRPTAGTVLEQHAPPTACQLARVYQEAEAIVAKHGVKLGPRCIPCQHNTLTFPDDSGAYYFS